MEWIKELQRKFESGVAHQFLLYLNTQDIFLKEKKLLRLDEFLLSSKPLNEAGIVVFYNRGTGLQFLNRETRERFLQALDFDKELLDEELPVSPERVFPLLDRLVHCSWKDSEAIEVFGEEQIKQAKEKGKPYVGLVIEYLETLVPSDAASSSNDDDRNILVRLLRWAQDKKIRDNRNIIIAITKSLDSVASSLRSADSGIVPIKIPIPDRGEREKTVQVLRELYPSREGDISSQQLVHFSAGLSRQQMAKIIKEVHYFQPSLSSGEVFDRKKKIIEEESGGMLEIKRSLWPPETIGALKKQKRYLDQLVSIVERGKLQAIPMGVLIVGAPGTGKTIFVEVLSYKIDWPIIVLKNFQSMWYGETEARLELILEIIRALTPAICFIDEIDLVLAARAPIDFGDAASRTESRSMKRFFEFMSDTTLRGEVIWFGITNRPDRLDAALIRAGRFDVVIPFPIPQTEEERKDIILALLKKNEIDAQNKGTTFQWELSNEEIDQLAKRAQVFFKGNKLYKPEQLLKKDVNLSEYENASYTGGEIENVIRAAYFLAQSRGEEVLKFRHLDEVLRNYLPARDFKEYAALNDMALSLTTNLDFLSEKEQKKVIGLRSKPKKEREEWEF